MKYSRAFIVVVGIILTCCNPNAPGSGTLLGSWDKKLTLRATREVVLSHS